MRCVTVKKDVREDTSLRNPCFKLLWFRIATVA